jgi:uncharacterized protein involved in exopolysaccharide biosynthesis
MNIFEHVRMVLKYRRMVLCVCILSVGTAGTVTYLWPPSFVATASVVPPMEGTGEPGLGLGLLGGGGASLLRKVMNVNSVTDLYVGILESREVTDAMIDRFDLVRVYGRQPLTRYKARERLRRYTSIDASKEGILYVTVEDKDPNRAAAIANAYVEELDKQNKKLSVGQATSKRMFLETRLNELEQKLSRIDSIPSRQAQVQEMLYELLMRELEIAKIEEAKSMPTIQILDPAVPPEIRKPKGTIRKAALAGIVAFVCVMFFAFGREYYRDHPRRESMSPELDREVRRPGERDASQEDGKAMTLAGPIG